MTADFPMPRHVASNTIRLAVYEAGPKDGFPVILAHGFPELAYSWRHQIPVLANAGFHVIAPDQRGYGLSDKPKAISAYTIQETTADLVGLLDAYGHDKAVFCGHDWGGLVVWQVALMYPERVAGVIGINAPFFPRPAEDPVASWRKQWGDEWYIVAFQDSFAPDRMMDADPEAVYETQLRRPAMSYEEYQALPKEEQVRSITKRVKPRKGEPFATPEERQVYVDAYRRGGFTPPINWYRNWTRNWETTAHLEQKVHCPALYIWGADDPAIPPGLGDDMEAHVADVTRCRVPDCGHCTQQERPDAVNKAMLDWLRAKFG